MRISDILNLAKGYLWLGILLVGVLGIGYICWYCLYFKKKWPDRKINKGKLLGWGTFIVYLVVVFGATMLSRGSFYGNTKIYPLFYSYKDAWNDFSMTEWRNILLNIFMFVPFGFFLPQLIKKTSAFWKVSLLGFLFTLSIEVLQLLLKIGIFEPDDLLGNTLGAMIGYGVYYFGGYLMQKRKKERKFTIGRVFLCQIPLVVVIAVFSTIFLVYHLKELGNLQSCYIIRQENIEVDCDAKFSDKTGVVTVYKAIVMTPDETEKMARKLFEKHNCGIDESRTDIYENMVLYYSDGEDGNRYSIWMEYDGGVFTFRDFEGGYFAEDGPKIKEGASENEVREALGKLEIFVPKETFFTEEGEGRYRFTADKIIEDDKMYDGYVECTYYEDGMMREIQYKILALDAYKEMVIITEAEALQRVKDGKFSYYRANDDTLRLEISNVKLEYELDTKGYYQPVYQFDAIVNEREAQIFIPAIK